MQQNEVPLSENYHSLQGEGLYTGTAMHIIRMAGCSVGKIVAGGPLVRHGQPAWMCHTFDNRPFWCDTDFSKQSVDTVENLIECTWEDHILITGGEPLIHIPQVEEIIRQFVAARRHGMVHIETSGTIAFLKDTNCWITVSPKLGCLDEMIHRADEIKLLVDDEFHLEEVPAAILTHKNVYVQPINQISMVNRKHIQRCMELISLYPSWKLSVQLHKLLGLR